MGRRVDRAPPELVGRLARRRRPHEGRGAALKSIGDMGSWKFAAAAHAIATLAECEAPDVSQHK